MAEKSTAIEATIERKRTTAIATINELQSVRDLQDFALRLNKFPELADLIPLCQERILEVTANEEMARNERLLPEPFPHDHERAPLREYWVEAAATVGSVGTRTLQMVRRHGFRDAMLRQLAHIDDIGDNRFKTLKAQNVVHLSAEYLMRTYYADMLTEEQKRQIDVVMSELNFKDH